MENFTSKKVCLRKLLATKKAEENRNWTSALMTVQAIHGHYTRVVNRSVCRCSTAHYTKESVLLQLCVLDPVLLTANRDSPLAPVVRASACEAGGSLVTMMYQVAKMCSRVTTMKP